MSSRPALLAVIKNLLAGVSPAPVTKRLRYGFRRGVLPQNGTARECAGGWNTKKEPPLPAAQSNNREASNRVDRSHSVSRRWTVNVIKGKA
jgi:hypothetical protein